LYVVQPLMRFARTEAGAGEAANVRGPTPRQNRDWVHPSRDW
jgi:hypothetical protein